MHVHGEKWATPPRVRDALSAAAVGIAVRMLSGDARAVADSVAGRVGITAVDAPVRPEEKAGTVAQPSRLWNVPKSASPNGR